jgi:transmembrane sensor
MPDINTPSAQIPAAIMQQALEWQVNFWSGESSVEERRQFEHWLGLGPEQQGAWRHIQAMDSRLLDMASPSIAGALRDTRKLTARRRTLRTLLFISGSGLALYGARNTSQWQVIAADSRTRTGVQREVTLPDGGRLTLNTDSAVNIVYDEHVRSISLLRGEIHVATAADGHQPARPFIVETRYGRARAIGTRFTVRLDDDRSRVAVSQGMVELRPRQGDAVLVVNAGQEASFDGHDVGPARASPLGGEEWLRGLVIAERMPLREFLSTLARYRSGFLYCDPTVADLPVSGVFSIRDTDQTLAALLQVLPVSITYITRYWVSVSAA